MEETNAFVRELKQVVRGEVFSDRIHKTLYSSAACMYQIEPLAVAYPKDRQDVSAVLRLCYERSVPVIPRGAGSGLAGQAVGEGVILDLTRYMNQILEVDGEGKTARVQPGVVLSGLNKVLKASGLFFPPDPSSADYCTIGGMVANNSSGSRSLKYGATKDYVLSLEVVLSDGEIVNYRKLALDSADLKSLRTKNDHEGAIYTSMIGLLWRNRDLINEHWWKVGKNSSGYNLKEAFSDGFVDLTKIMVGSEGTLGVVTEVGLSLLEIPAERSILLLFFEDMRKAGEAVLEARVFEPSAIEFMNESFLRAARGIDSDVDSLVPLGSGAMLLIEFEGERKDEIEARARALARRIAGELHLSTGSELASTGAEMERVWRVRKAAVPIVMKARSRKRPVAFVEDTVVPPEKLPQFLEGLYDIFRTYSVDAPSYGHAGEGNVHVRPELDLSSEDDIRKMEGIARDVYALTKEMQGSPSGEHGDGLIRAPFLKGFNGPMYDLFYWTKRIFDPKGILNPGKKIAESAALTGNLRFGPGYSEVPTGTELDERRFVEEVEACHGCGMCRSVVTTAMCPVYRALNEEKYTPRGKANLLRALISGRVTPEDVFQSREFREIVDKCFGCRMCSCECPTNVNIPLLVGIVRHEMAKKCGIGFRNRMFCNFDKMGRIGSATAPLSNLAMRVVPVRSVVQRMSGLSTRRRLPVFNRGKFRPVRTSRLLHGGKKVVYFPGCFVNFMDSRLGKDLSFLIEEADLELVVPHLVCCGIPSIAHGDLEGANKRAVTNIDALRPFALEGVPIVTTCPSCALALKAEYLELVGGADAEAVASSVVDSTTFLLDLMRRGKIALDKGARPAGSTVYHEPCHLKALGKTPGHMEELADRLGITLLDIDDACCGIGGTFGFKSANMEISNRVGRPLFDSIKQSGSATVVTECPTCRIQIEQATGLRSIHPVELVRRGLRK